jgi:hypothetical protein
VVVLVAVAANNPKNPYYEENGSGCRLLRLVRLDMSDCYQPDLPPIEHPSSTPEEYASLIYPVVFTYRDRSRRDRVVDGAPVCSRCGGCRGQLRPRIDL